MTLLERAQELRIEDQEGGITPVRLGDILIDIIETKALLRGDETLTFNVDTATHNSHAVPKEQLDELLTLKADKTSFESHTNNQSNPHNVSKAQTGLGKVRNVTQYSQTEADAKFLEEQDVLGTTNQISISRNGDGTVTIETPQDLHSGANFEVESLKVNDTNIFQNGDNFSIYPDGNGDHLLKHSSERGGWIARDTFSVNTEELEGRTLNVKGSIGTDDLFVNNTEIFPYGTEQALGRVDSVTFAGVTSNGDINVQDDSEIIVSRDSVDGHYRLTGRMTDGNTNADYALGLFNNNGEPDFVLYDNSDVNRYPVRVEIGSPNESLYVRNTGDVLIGNKLQTANGQLTDLYYMDQPVRKTDPVTFKKQFIDDEVPQLQFKASGTSKWGMRYVPGNTAFVFSESGVSDRVYFHDGGGVSIGTDTDGGYTLNVGTSVHSPNLFVNSTEIFPNNGEQNLGTGDDVQFGFLLVESPSPTIQLGTGDDNDWVISNDKAGGNDTKLSFTRDGAEKISFMGQGNIKTAGQLQTAVGQLTDVYHMDQPVRTTDGVEHAMMELTGSSDALLQLPNDKYISFEDSAGQSHYAFKMSADDRLWVGNPVGDIDIMPNGNLSARFFGDGQLAIQTDAHENYTFNLNGTQQVKDDADFRGNVQIDGAITGAKNVTFPTADIGDLSISGSTIENPDGNLTLRANSGEIFIEGEVIKVNKEVTATDAVLELNTGEPNDGVTGGFAGISIFRGPNDDTHPPYLLGFRESDRQLVLGRKVSDTNGDIDPSMLQPVLTRVSAGNSHQDGLMVFDKANLTGKTYSELTFDGSTLAVDGVITGNNINDSNWDTAFAEKINSISGSGDGMLTLTQQDGGTLTTNLDHTHGYDDLPIGSGDVSRWDESYNNYVSSMSGSGDGTLTLTRNNDETISVNLDHSHDYGDLPITSTQVSNWDTAYSNYITGISGSGDGTLTLTQNDGGTISTDLDHSHGYGDLPISSGNVSNWNQAYNNYITSVSGNGDGTLTLTQRDGGSISTNLAHSHGYDDLPFGSNTYMPKSGGTFTGGITVEGSGELLSLYGSGANTVTWIRMGTSSSYSWNVKYNGGTSGTGGNEFRIESTDTENYFQMDHDGNFDINNNLVYHEGHKPSWSEITEKPSSFNPTGDVFDSSGNYSGLRAQSTTKGDVGLGNVTNDKQMPISGGTFTGPVDLTAGVTLELGQLDDVDLTALDDENIIRYNADTGNFEVAMGAGGKWDDDDADNIFYGLGNVEIQNGNNLSVSGNISGNTLSVDNINTGHGNNELHPMNQGVRTSDDVEFENISAKTGTFYSYEANDADNVFDGSGLFTGGYFVSADNTPNPSGNYRYVTLGSFQIASGDSGVKRPLHLRKVNSDGISAWGEIWTSFDDIDHPHDINIQGSFTGVDASFSDAISSNGLTTTNSGANLIIKGIAANASSQSWIDFRDSGNDQIGLVGHTSTSDGRFIIRNNVTGDMIFQTYDGTTVNEALRLKDDGSIVANSASFSGSISASNLNPGNWNSAYNDVITGVSGGGDGTLTLTRRDGGTLTTSLNHSHGYGDLPISSGQVSNWNTAHNNHITGVSGNGDGTLTLTQNDGGTLTTSLSHSHSEYYSNGDNPVFGSRIGFGNDSAVFDYNDSNNESRSGYYSGADGMVIRGDNREGMVVKTGHLDLSGTAYVSGKARADNVEAPNGFTTGNFEIVHNSSTNSLDFNFVG